MQGDGRRRQQTYGSEISIRCGNERSDVRAIWNLVFVAEHLEAVGGVDWLIVGRLGRVDSEVESWRR